MAESADLRAILRRFPQLEMLVAGDVILDRYWWGEASRLSPEAPVPVVRRSRSTCIPGGAANTAANLASLGAKAQLVSVTGVDPEAAELRAALTAFSISTEHLLEDAGRPTTTKTRVIATHQQIVRVDEESTDPVSEETASRAAKTVAGLLQRASALVISDYAKGFLTPSFLGTVMGEAQRLGKPVFIDPKGSDSNRYRRATLLKPNLHELALLTGLPVNTREEAVLAGCRLSASMPETMILVTEGADGMTLFSRAAVYARAAAVPRQVFDVTGAGDTVMAAMALALTAGATCEQAMDLATEAAAIAIGLIGTSAVAAKQLESSLERISQRVTNQA